MQTYYILQKWNKEQQTLTAILLALLVGVLVIYGEGSPLILRFLSADVLNFSLLFKLQQVWLLFKNGVNLILV
jgi:hypothetical protein